MLRNMNVMIVFEIKMSVAMRKGKH